MFDELKNITSQKMQDAKSLPFDSYTSVSVYEKEKESIFYNDWVFACHEKELENSGDYFSMILCDEPIIIKRTSSNKIVVLSNICRHRGTMLLAEGFGNTKKLTCSYHAWSYDDEGKLQGAPFSKKEELNKDEHCLTKIRFEIWKGLIFVNLSSTAQPLSTRYKKVEKYLDLFSYEKATKAFSQENNKWNSNWKLILENAMESYHLFAIHKETLETITPTKDAFYLEGGEDFSISAGSMKSTSSTFDWIFGENKTKDFYVLISLPPSFVGILTGDGLTWLSINPISQYETKVRTAGINAYGSAGDKEEQDFSNAFIEEDKQICESVQIAMKSKLAKGGKLLEVERIVVDFHNYLGKTMFDKYNDEYFISSKVEEWFSS